MSSETIVTMIIMYNILVKNSVEKKILQKDNIKMKLKTVTYQSVDRTYLTQGRTVSGSCLHSNKHSGSIKREELLRCVDLSFSRDTLSSFDNNSFC